MARGDIRVRLLGDLSDLSDSLAQGANEIGGFARDLSSRAGLAAGAAGVAAGAVFVERFGAALDFGATQDQLAASLGLTEDAAALAGDAAASLYSRAWGESLDEVSAAIGQVARNDLVDLESASQDTVESITAGVLDISKAFTEDFGMASRTAGQLVRNGLAVDATQALDLLTAGFQGGADRAEDFLDTLNEYAPAFDRLGFDGATAIGLITQGLDAGAFNADKIGDAFNEFSIRAIDGSAATVEAVEALGFSYEEFAAQIAEGGPAAAEMSDDVIRALANIDDKVAQDAAGVALFGSMWEDLGADVILALNPAEAAITDFDGAAQRMGDTLNDNLGTKIETLKRTALTGLVTFMEDDVIPVVETVIDTFNEDGLAGVFDLVSEAIADALPDVLDRLEEMAGAVIDWIVDTAPEVADQLVEWGKEFVEWIGPQIPPMLRELGRLIGAMLTWLVENIDTIVVQLAEWGAAFIAWVAPMIPPLLVELAKLLGSLVAWIATDALPKLVSELAGWALAFVGWVADAATGIIAQTPTLVNNIVTAAARAGSEAVAEFGRWLGGLPGQFRDKGYEAGRSLVSGIIDGIGSLVGQLGDLVNRLPGTGGSGVFDDLIDRAGGGSSGGGSSVTRRSDGGVVGLSAGPGSFTGQALEPVPFSGAGQTIVVNQSFGVGTSPIEAGRAVEEVLFRFQQAGGQLRVQRDAAGVVTLSG